MEVPAEEIGSHKIRVSPAAAGSRRTTTVPENDRLSSRYKDVLMPVDMLYPDKREIPVYGRGAKFSICLARKYGRSLCIEWPVSCIVSPPWAGPVSLAAKLVTLERKSTRG
jgi:hypothetical protein